uniref:Photosystem I assembly protein Ycf4 n=1 Tax=Avrainvillea sp. HV04061 TaxID=2364086 RepID=A0A3B8DCM5_9CHLO|nr:photosystem I assembly protein Ycf4 [Avrainvillea sp. HV04061]
MKNNLSIRRYKIYGARRFSNIFWTILLFFGSCNFILTALSSYINLNLLPFIQYEKIQFFPQGLVMFFYGFLGLIFSFYLFLTIFWNIGSGFNEINKKKSYFRIFRWGFPGSNRRINFYYSFDEILGIHIDLKQGFNPQRTILLCLKENKKIPLTRVEQPLTIDEIEMQAAELSKSLKVELTIGKN